MKKPFIACIVLLVLLGCNKDKFQTKPQISLKLVTNSVVPANGGTTVVLSYTDKEGDISDTLFLQKFRLNQTVVPTLRDSIRYKIPDFPNYDKGEISIALTYQNELVSAQTPPPQVGGATGEVQPDTLMIKFWIHDKAGHVSDTVSTGQIVVIR